MTIRKIVGFARLGLALACVISLVARFFWGLGSATFTASNFFAYLTIQSNIVFALALIASGVSTLRGRPESARHTTLRAAVLTCTLTSGIVFAFLVQQAGERGFRIDVPWSDQFLHFWIPALALADWILSPGRGRAAWRAVFFAIGFAIVWGIATLIRGAIVGWYPYFFLDPNQVSGIPEFVLLTAIALSVFAVVGCGLVWLSRLQPAIGRKKIRMSRQTARD